MVIALYNKYRPKRLQDVRGQQSTKVLINSIKKNNIPQALIFQGRAGTGKTTSARLFAQAINCERLDQFLNTCRECKPCKNVEHYLTEVNSAVSRGIQAVNDMLDTIPLRPRTGKHRVIIFDEFHQLSTDAISALLKVVEEPPNNVVFIFCSTENVTFRGENMTNHDKAVHTLTSRCMTLLYNPIHSDIIKKEVKAIARKEKIFLRDETVDVIARKAKGSLRDAIGMIDVYFLMQDIGSLITPEEKFALQTLEDLSDFKSTWSVMRDIEDNFIEPYYLWQALLDFIRDVIFCKINREILHAIDVTEKIAELSKKNYDWNGLLRDLVALDHPLDYYELEVNLISVSP